MGKYRIKRVIPINKVENRLRKKVGKGFTTSRNNTVDHGQPRTTLNPPNIELNGLNLQNLVQITFSDLTIPDRYCNINDKGKILSCDGVLTSRDLNPKKKMHAQDHICFAKKLDLHHNKVGFPVLII